MKIRKGFVSNSSSSSFIIKKIDLTMEQIDKIKNYVKYFKNFKFTDDFKNLTDERKEMYLDELQYIDETWLIFEDDETINGEVGMDNFSMHFFFSLINIDNNIVEWGY